MDGDDVRVGVREWPHPKNLSTLVILFYGREKGYYNIWNRSATFEVLVRRFSFLPDVSEMILNY